MGGVTAYEEFELIPSLCDEDELLSTEDKDIDMPNFEAPSDDVNVMDGYFFCHALF